MRKFWRCCSSTAEELYNCKCYKAESQNGSCTLIFPFTSMLKQPLNSVHLRTSPPPPYSEQFSWSQLYANKDPDLVDTCQSFSARLPIVLVQYIDTAIYKQAWYDAIFKLRILIYHDTGSKGWLFHMRIWWASSKGLFLFSFGSGMYKKC